MGTQLEVVVGGKWLSMQSFVGNPDMSTCWPGGSDLLSWTTTLPYSRFHGGEDTIAYFGGVPVFRGHLLEPDPSQDQLAATGAWREGGDYAALDGTGAATATPDTAIDQAISRGLNWTRPASVQSFATAIDLTQGPVSVSVLLDMQTSGQTVRWGVDAYRQVFTVADPTAPSYQTLPLAEGLGYALDNYASTLVGRYLDTATSTYKTQTQTDATAEALHGHVERIVDLTPRGPRTAAQSTTILNNQLSQGRSTPQWTKTIEVAYGELLSMGGVPVALETVAAGNLLRVNGGFELAQRLNGAMYVDVLIGRTELSAGTLTLSPLLLAPRNLTDFLTSVAL